MLETFDALLAQPLLLLLVLGVGAACGMGVEKLYSRLERKQRQAFWRGRNSASKGKQTAFRKPLKAVPLKGSQEDRTLTASEQLRCVMEAEFKSRALLNKPERRLLTVIDKALVDHSPGWRAMAQVNLGEILFSHDKDAFFAINAKRVDLLIIDPDCRPLHAIEFQGTGHHGSPETAARDAVKKEALRRAGIGYIEVVSGDTPNEVRAMVRKLVERVQA